MAKRRLHEIAKELGIENKAAVLALQAAGVAVKSHSSTVYEEEVLEILKKVKRPPVKTAVKAIKHEAPVPKSGGSAEEEMLSAPKRPGMTIVRKVKTPEPTAALESKLLSADPDLDISPSEVAFVTMGAGSSEDGEEAERENYWSRESTYAAHLDRAASQDTEVQEEQDKLRSSAPKIVKEKEEMSGENRVEILQNASMSPEVGSLLFHEEHRASLDGAIAADESTPDLFDEALAEPSFSEDSGVAAESLSGGGVAGRVEAESMRSAGGSTFNAPEERAESSHKPAGAKPPFAKIPQKATAATVVRMIDRDKLLERIPRHPRAGGDKGAGGEYTRGDQRGDPRKGFGGYKPGERREIREISPRGGGAPQGYAGKDQRGGGGDRYQPRPGQETSRDPRATNLAGGANNRLKKREFGRGTPERPDNQNLRTPGGAPGQPSRQAGLKYGQVTELRVVNDPFGRGREMVGVGGKEVRDTREYREREKKGKGAKGNVSTGNAGAARKEGRASLRQQEPLETRERSLYPARLKKKKAALKKTAPKVELTPPKAAKRVIKMKEQIVVADLAHQLGVKAAAVIRKLMSLGLMISQNASIDHDTAQLVAADYDYRVESLAFAEDDLLKGNDAAQAVEDPQQLQPRPPVVTVMGHVDHGKTSLLDAIRQTRVAFGEAGGITQHIGACIVKVPGKGSITFLDTPGHAAFTSMRARGAKITDIVVLVVAADDGVMPQTAEALKHAQDAGVPLIVAINKIDKPEANPDRVMQELTKYNLLPEEWGGETLYVKTSATKGTGITELLESILLQAEMLDLKANPHKRATAVVIEAKLDRGRGPVATVLIEEGTLYKGDALVVGDCFGKVRAMADDQGVQINEAGPALAVEITGLDNVPEAGDKLFVVASLDDARTVVKHRKEQKQRAQELGTGKKTLDDLFKRLQEQDVRELKIVLKADVQGSVEALSAALLKLATADVQVSIVYGGVGGINERDIMLAAASGGIVIGFGVRPDSNVRGIAERQGVEIRTYNIIYEVVDDVKKAMEGLLTPETREKILGRAEVREVFKISKVGTIAGCRVVDGKASRAGKVRVLRDSVQIYEGKLGSLKHFKNDVREVDSGLECGVGIEGFNDLKVGDNLEFYQLEEIARTLGAPLNAGGSPANSQISASMPA